MKRIFPLRLIVFLLLIACALAAAPYQMKTAKDSNGFTYQYVPDDPFGGRVYTLSNGMRLYLSRNDRQPRIQTYVAVRAGAADDPLESTGLAHYFEHMMFKGNHRIASLDWEKEKPLLDELEQLFEQHRKETDPAKRAEIYKKIDAVSLKAAEYSNDEYWEIVKRLGATGTNAWTSFDETVYVNDIPASALEKFLRLESSRFQAIALRRFHTELETVYEEFNMMQDQDHRRAYFAAMELLFGKHPYGRHVIGLPEHIKAPSMRDINTFFRERYTPDNMALILSGSLDYDKTAALAEQYFGKIPAAKAKVTDRAKRRASAGEPLKAVRKTELSGHMAERLVMMYRFEATRENELMLKMISEILSNGKCGILDKNLIIPQKVLSMQAGYSHLLDFSMFAFVAQPREGQTLEELHALILGELEKLKNGDFPDWLPDAVINNARLGLATASENRGQAASLFVKSFIHDQSLADILNSVDESAQITKAQICAFAKKHFNDNYALVFKRSGEPSARIHAEKPPITPIPVKNEPSAFAREIYAMPSIPDPEPVFPDFGKELYRNGKHYAAKNTVNERFSLTYVFPKCGSLYDLKVPLAFSLIPYLSRGDMTPARFQEECYKLAADIDYSTDRFNAYITVSGLQRNFDAICKLIPSFDSFRADEKAFEALKEDILKSRANARKDQWQVFHHASRFALYGTESLINHYLPEAELKKLSADDMVKLLSNFTQYQTEIFYYGPADPDSKVFPAIPGSKAGKNVDREHVKFRANPLKEDQVLLVDYPSAQTIAFLVRVDAVNDPKPFTFEQVFGDYARLKFWTELRERRAMAYSAGGYYSNPTIMLQDYSTSAIYVMTQPDKLPEAIPEMKKQLDNAPVEVPLFATARNSILSRIRNSRLLPESYYGAMLDMKRRGLNELVAATIYRELQSFTADMFQQEWEKRIRNRPTLLVVLGDLKRIDRKSLAPFGTIRTVTLEEIFRK